MRVRWDAVSVFVVALSVYVATMSRTIVIGDGPEFTVAAHLLGVSHPTGYPLYTMLGAGALRALAFGSPAFRMHLLSGIAGAAAVTCLYFLARSLTRSRWLALVTALLFAFSATFWSTANVAEVYSLHMLFVAILLLQALSLRARPTARGLTLTAALTGLAFTHHLMTVTLVPALVYAALASRAWRMGRVTGARAGLLLLLPLCLYAYLPIAAWRDPGLNWGDCRTPANFIAHVTGAQYRYRMGVRSVSELLANVRAYAGMPVHSHAGDGHSDDHEQAGPGASDEQSGREGYLLSQYSLALLWLAPIGLYGLWRRRRGAFWVTVLAYAVPTAWALNYSIPDIEPYYATGHLVVALWIGCGIRECLSRARLAGRRARLPVRSRRRIGLLASGVLLVLPLGLLASGWQANDRRKSAEAMGMAHAAMDYLRPSAVVIAGGDQFTFPLLYAHYVVGLRPDIVLILPEEFNTGNYRLVERLQGRGLVTGCPECTADRVPETNSAFCRLRRFILNNRARRPVYIVGAMAAAIDSTARIKRAMPPYTWPVKGADLILFWPTDEATQVR